MSEKKAAPQETTYSQRVFQFLKVIDPRTLLVSEHRAKELRQRLQDPALPSAERKHAERIVTACFHPNNNEFIFPLFRMAAFIPVNIPIVVGLLNSRGMAGTLFWQWINQSYNVCVNYANRNTTTEVPRTKVLQSYGIAVGTSCSIAAALKMTLDRATRMPPFLRTGAQIFLPITAISSAGALNLYFMRREETLKGIDVVDVDGTILGTSVIAGKQAVQQVMLSRVFLPVPTLLLPPVMMIGIDRLIPALAANKRARMLTELVVITFSLGVGLPASIGLFPQHMKMSLTDLEPSFKKKYPNLEFGYCNKGL